MQRCATSKKRAAEAEKEINMEDKEATPVEDVETLLTPVGHKQPAPPEEQPEKPSQTENMTTQEMIRQLMETMKENSKKLSKDMEENNKERKEDNQSLNKKLEELKEDVYKRQVLCFNVNSVV